MINHAFPEHHPKVNLKKIQFNQVQFSLKMEYSDKEKAVKSFHVIFFLI